MRKRKPVLLVGASSFAALVVGIGLHQEGHAEGFTDPPPQGNYTLEESQEFPDFALYNAGGDDSAGAFDGNPLVAVVRSDEPADPAVPVNVNFVSFVYGDCESEGLTDDPEDQGCLPPVEVQVWPACERNPAVYEADEVREATIVRSVPAYFYEEDTRLEISTGDVTVVIFGDDRPQLLEAAESLGAVNRKAQDYRPVGDRDPNALPPPVPGALEGTLSCESPPNPPPPPPSPPPSPPLPPHSPPPA